MKEAKFLKYITYPQQLINLIVNRFLPFWGLNSGSISITVQLQIINATVQSHEIIRARTSDPRTCAAGLEGVLVKALQRPALAWKAGQ